MLFNKCMKMMPLVVLPLVGRRLITQPVRTLFSPWHRHSALAAILRDMEHLERQMFRSEPLRLLRIPDIDHAVEANDGQYRLSVDLAGFKPEEIKLDLDGTRRRLTISAKCERQRQDGTRVAQEMSRTVVLPESIDVDLLTSALHHDGVLAIEAPFKEQQEPQQKQQEPHRIPIGRAKPEELDAGDEVPSSSSSS